MASAQSPDILVDGGFEAGGSGWIAYPGTQLDVDASGPVHSGSAAHVIATSGGTLRLETQYWLTTAYPTTAHTLRGWFRDEDSAIESVSMRLRFLDADGNLADEWATSLNGDTAGYRQLVIGPANSPSNAAYVQVVVTATVLEAGATFSVDSVTLEQGAPPPPPTAVVSATASATPSSTPTTTPTATPTKTATPSPTPTRTATPPRGPIVFDELTNGDFSLDLLGWNNQGGDLYVGGGYINDSPGAVLMSHSSATKWLYQVVRVDPGAWYEASGWIAGGGDAAAVWLRIAWYESDDGSGSQLAVVDSAEVAGGPQRVVLGPTQAPPNARSAAIRLVLRPASGAFASVAADDVAFGQTTPPPKPTPTPTPTATAVPLPTVLPSPAAVRTTPAASRPEASSSSATTTGPSTSASAAPAVPSMIAASLAGAAPAGSPGPAVDGQGSALVRITEVLPDSPEPGLDADYEWVEITNWGSEGASLAGLVLRDNAGAISLPDVVLPPRGVLLVAGALADVGAAISVQRVEEVGNGLGNAGDRLILESASGGVVDALSWGSESTYRDPEAPIPAPGPGRSIERRFADDGSYLGFAVLEVPTPGLPPEVATIAFADSQLTSMPAPASQVAQAATDDRTGWLVLLAVASVALVAAVVARVREVVAERRA